MPLPYAHARSPERSLRQYSERVHRVERIEHWLHLLSLGLEGKLEEATAFHAANMRPLIDALFSEPNPAPIKATLAIMGNDFGDVLTPLQPASTELREKLRKMLPQYQSREAEL